MVNYPFWIRIEFRELDNSYSKGYTGSVLNENHFVDVVVRNSLKLSTIKKFEINNKEYPVAKLTRIFEKAEFIKREVSEKLKQGKNPTNAQKKQIKSAGLEPKDWLIVKNLSNNEGELHLINRTSGKPHVIAV